MRKKDKSQIEEPVLVQEELTDWQKRHLEFEEMKKERQLEKERQEAEELQRRKEELQLVDDAEPDELAVKKKPVVKSQVASNLRIALPALFLSFIVLIISLFFVSPFSKQKLFLIEGNNRLTQSEVVSAAGIKGSDYLTQTYFTLSQAEKQLVKNSPWVKTASFQYEFPNRFLVTVEEYDIIAYQETDQGWAPVLPSGAILETVSSDQLPETFMTLHLSDDLTKKFARQLANLETSLVASLQEVRQESSSTHDLLTILTQEGHTIRVPLADVSTKLPYYQTIKQGLTDVKILDMEVGIYATTADLEALSQETKARYEQAVKEAEEAEANATEATEQDESTGQTE